MLDRFKLKILTAIEMRQFSEIKYCKGLKHIGKTFYIIRPFMSGCGLMSIHNSVLYGIRYALSKGYIPVVDYQNYKNLYLTEDKLGRENSWEYYFEQPCGYHMQDINRAFKIIRGGALNINYSGIDDDAKIEEFNKLIKTNCKPNERMRRLIQEALQTVLPKQRKVLGVVGRGTDYTSTRPSKHAIVPGEAQLTELVQEWLDNNNEYKYIFLATEDKKIYEMFKRKFPNQLIDYNVMRFDSNTQGMRLAQTDFFLNGDVRKQGEEYLVTVYLLAGCDSIITPVVGAGLAAIRINGGAYENRIIINMGSYD